MSLIDPYAELPFSERERTTIRVANHAKSYLRSLHPGSVVQSSANILIDKLIQTLKANGYTDYDPAGFERAISECTIVLGNGRTTIDSEPRRQTNQSNDRHGATTMARQSASPPGKPANAGSVPGDAKKVKKGKST
jgi:hypothetical protein